MNSGSFVKTVMLICCVIFSSSVMSQSIFPKYELGIYGGTFIYQGDLTPSPIGSYRFITPSFQISIAKLLDENFAIRANFNRGDINGDDSRYATPNWRRQRNFSFNTSITELSGSLVWNFYTYTPDGTKRKLSTYIFGGAGISFLNIKRNWSGIDTTVFNSKTVVLAGLAKDTLHRLPAVIPVIPVGVGIRYALNNQLSIAAELTYRITFTDYLDGFSKSADPTHNDYYYGYSIGLIYTFEKSVLKCPRVKN